MMWEQKVWGVVAHLFQSDHAAMSFLKLKKGFRCSRHFHKQRVNMFAVVSGEVLIEEWYGGQAKTEIVLRAGDSATVLANIEHRFRVLQDGQMIEVYWPMYDNDKVSLDDIVRLDEGGPDVDPSTESDREV
jgi:mannose-6-phosphate isomerase-like protein (cupin superfamily)